MQRPQANLSEYRDGMIIRVAGLVLVRQRPGTAGGVCFITIEDETGFANLVVFQNLFETYRKEILQGQASDGGRQTAKGGRSHARDRAPLF